MMLANKKVTFRVTLVFICLAIAALTAIVAIGLQYYFSKQITVNASQQFAEQVARQMELSVSKMDVAAKNSASLLAQYSGLIANDIVTERTDHILADLLVDHNDFYAIYFGFANGDFYELINLETNDKVRRQLNAAHEDRFVRIHIYQEAGSRVRKTDYLDEHLNVRHSLIQPSEYDATSRHWFINANPQEVVKSWPYLFEHLQASGQTYSKVVAGTNHVVAVDLTLQTVAEQLSGNFQTTEGELATQAFIFGDNGDLLLSNITTGSTHQYKSTPLILSPEQQELVREIGELTVSNETDWAPIDFSISGEPKGYSPELLTILGEKLALPIKFVNGYSWSELIDLYQQDKIKVLQPVNATIENQHWGYYSEPLLATPISLVTLPQDSQLTSIGQLKNKVLAIPKGWSIINPISKAFPEVEILLVENLKEALLAVKNEQAFATVDSHLNLVYTANMYFIEGLQTHQNINTSLLSFDTNLRLVSKNKAVTDLLNVALQSLTASEINYLQNRWLSVESSKNQTINSASVPYKELISLAENRGNHGKLQVQEIAGDDYLVFLAPTSLGASLENYLALMIPTDQAYKKGLSYVSHSILVTFGVLCLLMPLTWLIANPIVKSMRRLSIENQKIKERNYSALRNEHSFISEIDDVFISLKKMSVSIQSHEKKQAELLDSFVKLIAQAIDDKSPYTAGHCNRVPELGLMLADQASNSQDPYFQSFSLDNSDKQREFRLAAWLHDCGKIITPEHIVDKGTKLECIYNRIHEIRMRFEVLLRDAQLDFYRELELGKASRLELDAQLASKKRQLQQDYEFVASINQGGEFMAAEKLEKLEKIAKTTWLRHFSDVLGLSPQEELGRDLSPQQFPVTEYLISDKSTHIRSRDKEVSYAPHLGIKMDVPKDKANLGELYNLKISRGTLTAEDRFIINEHIIGTIKMLDSLPFPEELANVPRYASTHHETLKGTGYPRKLTADDLSIPERILVLADIFEALTASDRPYKRAKPLSVAIDILYKMCLDNHVDIEVFRLFLTSGVYLQYANAFMPKGQIDKVDVNKYLCQEKSA